MTRRKLTEARAVFGPLRVTAETVLIPLGLVGYGMVMWAVAVMAMPSAPAVTLRAEPVPVSSASPLPSVSQGERK